MGGRVSRAAVLTKLSGSWTPVTPGPGQTVTNPPGLCVWSHCCDAPSINWLLWQLLQERSWEGEEPMATVPSSLCPATLPPPGNWRSNTEKHSRFRRTVINTRNKNKSLSMGLYASKFLMSVITKFGFSSTIQLLKKLLETKEFKCPTCLS